MKLLRYSGWVVAFIFLVASATHAHHWVRKLNNESYSVAYNPRNTQTIYAGTGSTISGLTLSVSYNAGETWTTLTSLNDSYDGIRFIAVHPVDTTIMFAGGAHLWRTTDGGVSWFRVLDWVYYDGESFLFDPVSPNITYTAGLSRGFFRSTDGGLTWTVSPGTETNGYCTIAIRPDSTNILYGGTEQGSISKSTDYGLTWRVVLAPDPGGGEIPKIVIDPQNPVVGHASKFGGGGGAWRTTDGGETWFASGLAGIWLWPLHVDQRNPSSLLTGTFSRVPSHIYRSADFGQTWFDYSLGLPGSENHWMVKIVPADTELVFLASSNGVYKLQRGGASIGVNPSQVNLPAGFPDDTVRATFFVQNIDDTIRVDSIRGILFNYTFNPPTPIYLPYQYDSVFVSLVLPQGFGVFRDTILLWSSNLTVNPKRIPVRVQVGADMTLIPSLMLFPSGRGGDTVRSLFYVQNGNLSVQVDSIRSAQFAFVFDPPMPYYAPSVYDSVDVSLVLPPTLGIFLDTIRIWSRDIIFNPKRVPVRVQVGADMALSPALLSFPAGQGGDTVHRNFYVQNGDLMIQVDSMRGIQFNYTFEPPTPTYQPSVYDSVSVSLVLPTTPGIFPDTIRVWSRDLIFNPKRIPARVQIGADMTLSPSLLSFPSGRGGDTVRSRFYVQNGILSVQVDSIRGTRYAFMFDPPAPSYVPFANDSVSASVVLPPTPGFPRDTIKIWSHDLAINPKRILARLTILTAVEPNVGLPNAFTLSQNYPNPFNPRSIIEYEIPRRLRVAIRLYDLLGKQVRMLVDEVKEPGIYNAVVDVSGLSSGVYFYRMVSGDFVETRKLVVIK